MWNIRCIIQVLQLLHALNVLETQISSSGTNDIAPINAPGDGSVELSLTSTYAFAGSLKAYLRRNSHVFVGAKDFECSEGTAEKAIGNLNLLVRSSVLEFTHNIIRYYTQHIILTKYQKSANRLKDLGDECAVLYCAYVRTPLSIAKRAVLLLNGLQKYLSTSCICSCQNYVQRKQGISGFLPNQLSDRTSYWYRLFSCKGFCFTMSCTVYKTWSTRTHTYSVVNVSQTYVSVYFVSANYI